jgi:peptidoglycan/xylan/chitin deacetylase (PgdA/CDA1 family)
MGALAKLARRLGVFGITLLALALPVAITIWVNDLKETIRPVRSQTTTSISELSLSDAANYAQFATRNQPGILVLCYHDVRPGDGGSTRTDRENDIYTVTPEEFAAHLQMLRAAGFESVSTESLVRSLNDPHVLPPRPVVITFDDGTSGLWQYADPLLKQYGFRGVAFTITGMVNEHYPYYLTWEEIKSLHATGRWDIESHTHRGHDRIPSAEGREGPFLINLVRYPDGSFEKLDDAQARLTADADQAIDQLIGRGLPRPDLFAYPFSAESTPSNSPEIAAVSRRILDERYTLLMINRDPPRWAGADDMRERLVPRIEVTKQTPARALFDRIAAAAPSPTRGEAEPPANR